MKTRLLFILLFLSANTAQAGVSSWLGEARSWWKQHTLAQVVSEDDAPTAPTEPSPEEPLPEAPPAEASAVAQSGACQVPRETERISCAPGAGLLCVNTPDGGSPTDLTVLKGTMDRTEGLLTLTVTVQHEYKRTMQKVDTAHPIFADCWNDPTQQEHFCIDPEGRFTIPLKFHELGPYAIAVAAEGASGKKEHKEFRISRVLPVDLKKSKLVLDPDVQTQKTTDAEYVQLKLNLLEDCQSCDFIGAGTQAVQVEVESTIKNGDSERQVRCATRIEQGLAGEFHIGVPVFRGENHWKISACNAANQNDCVWNNGITFQGNRKDETLRFTQEMLPSYDATQYPQVPLSFQFGDLGVKECVKLLFNREPERELCSDETGKFPRTASEGYLQPQVGVNVLIIKRGDEEYPWTFGWGKIQSPFAELVPTTSLGLGLNASFVEDTLFPMLGRFLQADEFSTWLEAALKPQIREEQTDADVAQDKPVVVQGCSEKNESGIGTSLRGKPKIGKIKLEGAKLSANELNFSINADDVRVDLNLMKDKNHDGVPDEEPLPLFISMKKAVLDFRLQKKEEDGKVLWLLNSPHNDCDFKRKAFCHDKPASLIPDNFMGNASELGHFVMCDVSQASSNVKDLCKAINTLNAQTGALSLQVLDSVNEQLYCTGSALLTKTLQQGVKLPVPGLPEAKMNFDQLDLGVSGLEVMSELLFDISTNTMPLELHLPSVGWITDPQTRVLPSPQGTSPIEALLSLDLINQIIFALGLPGATGESQLQYDIDETSLANLDFDFHAKCDDVKEVDQLCQFRPRVQNMLGTALTSYGYFPADYPLMLSLKANPALSPRVSLTNKETLDVQLGGAELSFYALDAEKDEAGIYHVKLDENGKSQILSMRPEDADLRNGPIIRFDLSLLLALKIGSVGPKLDAETGNATGDWVISVHIIPEQARFVLVPLGETNATTIPAVSLVTQLKQKIPIALQILSEKPFNIPVPKKWNIPVDEESWLTRLGLREVSWSEKGFLLEALPESNALRLQLDPKIFQELHVGGILEKWDY